MPLKPDGEKVLTKHQNEYGEKNGKSVFYALINKGRLSKNKMEGRSGSKGRNRGR